MIRIDRILTAARANEAAKANKAAKAAGPKKSAWPPELELNIQPDSVALVGTAEVADLSPELGTAKRPSDHYGVTAIA